MPANPSAEGTLNGGRLCRAVTRARLHGTLCVSRVLGVSLPLRLCRAAQPCQNGPSRLPGQPWRGTEPCCVPLIAAWKGCACFTPEGGHSDGHLPGSSYCKFRASNSVAVHICGRLNGDHTRPGNVLMKWGGPCGEVWVPLPASCQLPAPGMQAFLGKSLAPAKRPLPGEGTALGSGMSLLPACGGADGAPGLQGDSARCHGGAAAFPCQRAGAPP